MKSGNEVWQNETIKKEIESRKEKKREGVRNQELKNKILEKFTSTVNTISDQAEERISELEDMSFEVTKSEEREWGKKRKWRQPRGLMGHHWVVNVHIMEVSEGDEREKGAKSLFKETMAENFPNLREKMDIQI